MSTSRGRTNTVDKLSAMRAAAATHKVRSGPQCSVCTLDKEAREFVSEQLAAGTTCAAISAGLAAGGYGNIPRQRIQHHKREGHEQR